MKLYIYNIAKSFFSTIIAVGSIGFALIVINLDNVTMTAEIQSFYFANIVYSIIYLSVIFAISAMLVFTRTTNKKSLIMQTIILLILGYLAIHIIDLYLYIPINNATSTEIGIGEICYPFYRCLDYTAQIISDIQVFAKSIFGISLLSTSLILFCINSFFFVDKVE